MPDDLSPAQKIVLGHVKLVAKLFVISATVSLLAVVARATGQPIIEVMFIKTVPVRYTWLVLLALTVAHFFWAVFILRSLEGVASRPNLDGNYVPDLHASRQLLDSIRSDQNPFLRGLVPRTERVAPGSRILRMSLSDSTAWLSLALATLVFVAVFPWSLQNGALVLEEPATRTLILIVLAVALVVLNWYAGGVWIIALSQAGEGTANWAFWTLDSGMSGYIPGMWILAGWRAKATTLVALGGLFGAIVVGIYWWS